MRYTLLQLTQMIMSSMDSDEINSINDTVESQQVVKVIQTAYGDIFSRGSPAENYTLFNLTASGDADKPTLMTLPTDSVINCLWVKYDSQKDGDTDPAYQPVEFVCLTEFLTRMHGIRPSEDSDSVSFTHSVDDTSITFIAKTDVSPTYYTTWDDETFIFNSYDSDVDTTLQANKTLCYGERVPPWTESDTFVIPLDDHQLLLHESKALAWAEIRQLAHPRAERSARTQWVQFHRTKHKIPAGIDYYTMTPNYGRR